MTFPSSAQASDAVCPSVHIGLLRELRTLGTRTPKQFSGERGESETTGLMMKGMTLKKILNAGRLASQIATIPFESQPPLIRIKNNLDLMIRMA